jgi:organic radical activating enzyme
LISIIKSDSTINQYILDLHNKFDIVGTVDFRTSPRPNLAEIALQLRSFYQESYQNNQRIIVVIDQEIYGEYPAGLILQSVQNIINDIDISNFFIELVTTNPGIETEYSWILKNISIDSVPFNINLCNGPYSQLPEIENGIKFLKFTKEQSFRNFENLDKTQLNLLTANSSFCMVPWTHMMISPDSSVTPCCANRQLIGDASKSSLKEIWNSDTYRKIRLDMLAGKPVDSCQTCYANEAVGKDSMRQGINRSMGHRVAKVESTDVTGRVEPFELNYFDSRFDNLCNLSCRSCGPTFSSSWHDVAIKFNLIDKSQPAMLYGGRNPTDIFDQIIQHIDHIDKIYFAGGEPLINEQSWQILDELDRRKRYNVELTYNTNFTQTQYRGRSIFPIWNKFSMVSVGASLDGEYARGEYLRSGTKWAKVIKNRQEMLAECPQTNFYIASTVGIMNALHLPDFHRAWVDAGLIAPDDFNAKLLFTPEYMRVDSAPAELKQQIRNKYRAHLDWLIPLDRLGRATNGFESVLEYINNDRVFDPDLFWTEVDRLDQYYSTDLIEVFPELSCLTRNSNSVII